MQLLFRKYLVLKYVPINDILLKIQPSVVRGNIWQM